jgi:NADPH-dependent curcumin reductase
MAQAVRLVSTPESMPKIEHFECVEVDMPEPADGEALVETLYLSLDPYMRSQIAGRHMSGSVLPGDILRGEAVSRVIKSRNPALREGDVIAAHSGWRSHALVTPEGARPLGFSGLPESYGLGVLGMPGLTAYAGLLLRGEPKPGDNLLVSSAAGCVGATVGQIGRIKGCRTIGIAGGAEKCGWLKNTARFDEAIDYKNENLREAIDRHCPATPPYGGIDIYYDNIGGDMLQAAMERLAFGARVVLCGLMDQYNSKVVPTGPNPALIIRARATVRGVVVYDHEDLRSEMVEHISSWIRSGDMVVKEDITIGLEQAGAAFVKLLSGATYGKVLVKLT